MRTKTAVAALAGILASANVSAGSTSDVAVPAGAEIKATALRLLQPSNARRLEQLQSMLRERDLAFELQPVPNPQHKREPRAEGNNVVVTIGSAQSEASIVIGAHFDAAIMSDGKLSGGMVDNASSVAVLVHLAAALKDRSLKHRVQVVFFDLEELGLVGSRHFAGSSRVDRIRALINLDTLQGGSTIIFGPTAPAGNEDVDRHMRRVCLEASLDCLGFPKFPPSDERSFNDVGVPSISVAVVPRIEAHQLWLLLNGGKASGLEKGFEPDVLRTIHTPADQPGRLDPDTLSTAYRGAMALLLALDVGLP
jgi:Zn-dependent M28 family amino/carboxypeptidase